MTNRTCCFIGHRKINITDELYSQTYTLVEKLITNESVFVFLFGSKSQFNDFCYNIVTKLKEKYPYIIRIYVRAEYLNISQSYKKYLLEKYEKTYSPKNIMGAGKSIYIKRNFEMIDKSKFCILYYNENMQAKNHKSGTKTALKYAVKSNKTVFVLPKLTL